MPALPSRSGQNKWRALFGLWTLHGVIAFWQFAAFSADDHDFLFGLSLSRLFLSVALLLWIVLAVVLMIFVSGNTLWWIKLEATLSKAHIRDMILIAAILVVLLRISLGFLRGLFGQQLILQYGGYMDLLSPIMNLMTYVSVEIIILVIFLNFHGQAVNKKPLHEFFTKFFIVIAVLGLVAAFVSLTDLGIAQGYKGDWSRGLPAVPLLEWQIILACLFCLGMLLSESGKKGSALPRLDVWICLAIWLGTTVLWLSQPIIPNASALKPHEPNFEIYPFIDSQTYDEFSQSVLVGNGFGDDRIPQRPLYIVFLVLVHAWVGQDYGDIIVVQSLVFASFPVLLYLFGREFLGRPLGISIALLAALRDYTSNIVSPFTGNISYSKLYLSEIPTAIFLVLFLLIGMRWIKAGFPLFLGFLLGGILGIAMLIRTQVIVALPIVLLFALLVQPRKIMPLLRSVLLMLLTITLVVSPWLWRNWRMTGELIFDSPESQTINLALRYSRLNGVEPDVMPQPGESSSDYNDRLKATAWDAISSNPWGAVRGVVNSFLNHGVNNILLFPLRNDLQTPGELWSPTDAFWEKWEGTPTLPQSLLLVFYVFLFGLGLTIAWVRNGWLGLLPLALNLIYNMWTSLALLSGQRFMLTMDWSIYLYYMIGLFTLIGCFLLALEGRRSIVIAWVQSNPFSTTRPAVKVQWRQYVFAGALFFGIGISLPLSEAGFPEKYPPTSRDAIVNSLSGSPALSRLNINFTCLQKMVLENQLSIGQGRALYPRYYSAGDGESFTDAVGYKIADEGRLVFDMVGQVNDRIIFRMSQSPDFFPNAADATLFLDKAGKPWFIFIKQGDVERFYVSESVDLPPCGSH